MNIIIIGGGQIGEYLGLSLAAHKHNVKIIENRQHVIEALKRTALKDDIICGDGSSPRILTEAGIRQVDVLAAVTGKDEVNLIVSTLAKYEFGVPKVIARINNPKNKWLFTPAMGVDDSVNQAEVLSDIILSEMGDKHKI